MVIPTVTYELDDTFTTIDIDDIVSSAIRVVMLKREHSRVSLQNVGKHSGSKAKRLEELWTRVVRANKDLVRAVGKLKDTRQ